MRGHNLRFAASVAATVLVAFSAAAAKTTAWIGGWDNLLSTAQNWNNGLPANGEGDTVIISNLSSSAISVCNDIEGLSCANLSTSGDGPVILYGNPVTLSGSYSNYAVDSVVSNDMTMTGGGGTIVDAYAKCALYGKIKHTNKDSALYSRKGAVELVFCGELDFTGRSVTLYPDHYGIHGEISFHGKVKASSIKGAYATGYAGPVHFYSSGNEIGTMTAIFPSYYLYTTNVFTESTIWSFVAHENSAHYILNGNDQTINRLNGGGQGSGGSNCIQSSDPATLTLKATASAQTGARIDNEISLVYDPQGDYVQSFTNRSQNTTGSLTVKGGTLRMDGTSKFAKVPTIKVESGATFDVATTNTGALAAVATLTLEGTGRFAVAPTAENLFGTTAKTFAWIDGSSRFVLPEGTILHVSELYVDKHGVVAGSYSQSSDETRSALGCVEGAGTLIVDSSPSIAWWTGAKDNNWNDVDNWEGTLPGPGVNAFIEKTGTVNVVVSSAASASSLKVQNTDGTTTLTIAADTAFAGGTFDVGSNSTVVVGNNALVTWDGTGVASSASEESVHIHDGGVVSVEGGILHFTNTTGQVTLGGGTEDPSGTLRITAGTCTVYRTSGNGLSFLKRGLLKMTGGVFAFDHIPEVQDGGEIDCSGNAQILADYYNQNKTLFKTIKARFAGSSSLKWVRLRSATGSRLYCRNYWNPNAANETNLFEFVDSATLDFNDGDYSYFGYGTGTTIFRADTTGNVKFANSAAVGLNGGHGEMILSNGTFSVRRYKFAIGGVFDSSLTDVYPTGYVYMANGTLTMGINPDATTYEGIVLGDCQANGANAARQWPSGIFELAGGKVTNNSWLTLGLGSGRGEIKQSGGTLYMSSTSRPFLAGQRGGTGIYNISGGAFTNRAGVYVGGCPTNIMKLYVKGLRAGQPGYGTLNVSGGSFATEKDIFIGLDGHGAMNVGTGGVVYAKNLHLTNSYDQVLDVPTAASLTFTPGAASSGSIVLSGALEVSDDATISIDASAYKSHKRVKLVKCASITGKALSSSDIDIVPDIGKFVLEVDQSGITLVPQKGSMFIIR